MIYALESKNGTDLHLEEAYEGAPDALKAQAARWSIPVGDLPRMRAQLIDSDGYVTFGPDSDGYALVLIDLKRFGNDRLEMVCRHLVTDYESVRGLMRGLPAGTDQERRAADAINRDTLVDALAGVGLFATADDVRHGKRPVLLVLARCHVMKLTDGVRVIEHLMEVAGDQLGDQLDEEDPVFNPALAAAEADKVIEMLEEPEPDTDAVAEFNRNAARQFTYKAHLTVWARNQDEADQLAAEVCGDVDGAEIGEYAPPSLDLTGEPPEDDAAISERCPECGSINVTAQMADDNRTPWACLDCDAQFEDPIRGSDQGRFVLEVKPGHDAMQTVADLAGLLERLADKLEVKSDWSGEGTVRDLNGNVAGRYTFDDHNDRSGS